MGTAAKPTVLFMVNDADFFVSHRLNLAIAVRQAGYRAVVSCPPGPTTRVFGDHGIEHVETVPVRRHNGLIGQLYTLISYNRVLSATRPDLVHLITAKPVIFGGALARLRGIPTVSAISGLGYVFTSDRSKVRLLRALVCRGYAFALNRSRSTVIFQNEVDRSIFARLRLTRHARTVIIKGSGVDLSRITVHAEPAGPPVVLLPARLLRDKGVEEFAQAARQVKAQHPSVVFRLQGKLDPENPTGLSADELARWIKEGWVEHIPYSTDVDRMLADVNLVALPSYREGFPKSLVDAAAAGRAVVTTDVPGCRDAIRPGLSGSLVPVRDAAALATAILDLIGDPIRRAAMGKEGRRLAEAEFDIERVTERHLELYVQALLPRAHA